MSFTTDDLTQFRTIVREEVDEAVQTNVRVIVREEVDSILTIKLKPIEDSIAELKGGVEALGNDVKEIYGMIPG